MSQINAYGSGFVHVNTEYPFVRMEPQSISAALCEFFNQPEDEALISMFLSLPVDMKQTFVPAPLWGNKENIFPLYNSVHTCIPAASPSGTVLLLTQELHSEDIAYDFTALGDEPYREGIQLTNKRIPFQFTPQDGGCKIAPDCSLVLTPALSGCSFFMLKVGEQPYAFHINVINDRAIPEKFTGVAYNILKAVARNSVGPETAKLKDALKRLEKAEQRLCQRGKVLNLHKAHVQRMETLKNQYPHDASTLSIYNQSLKNLASIQELVDEGQMELVASHAAFQQELKAFRMPGKSSIAQDVDTLFECYYPTLDPHLDIQHKLAQLMCKPQVREVLSGHYTTFDDPMENFSDRTKLPEIVTALVKDSDEIWYMIEQPLQRNLTDPSSSSPSLFMNKAVALAGRGRANRVDTPDIRDALHRLVLNEQIKTSPLVLRV